MLCGNLFVSARRAPILSGILASRFITFYFYVLSLEYPQALSLQFTLRMLANVLPRQSVRSAISWSIRCDGFIGSLCLQLLSRFYASSFAAASCLADLFEISRRRKWPFHIQSPERSSTGRKKDIPNTGGVVVSIRRRIINVTEYRNATDDVNPAKN